MNHWCCPRPITPLFFLSKSTSVSVSPPLDVVTNKIWDRICSTRQFQGDKFETAPLVHAPEGNPRNLPVRVLSPMYPQASILMSSGAFLTLSRVFFNHRGTSQTSRPCSRQYFGNARRILIHSSTVSSAIFSRRQTKMDPIGTRQRCRHIRRT